MAKEKRPVGRPPRSINMELLQECAQADCTLDEIAAELGVDPSYLDRNFAAVINSEKKKGKSLIRRYQMKIMKKLSSQMAVYLGEVTLKQTTSSSDIAALQESLNDLATSLERARAEWKKEHPTKLPEDSEARNEIPVD